jgi:hypothetical protein
MDRIATMTEQIQHWYDHSPKAQRAYARLADDVSTVNAWMAPKAHEWWERVALLLDPPAKSASADGNRPEDRGQASRS